MGSQNTLSLFLDFVTGPRLLSKSGYDAEANISQDEDSGEDELVNEEGKQEEADSCKGDKSGADNQGFSMDEKSSNSEDHPEVVVKSGDGNMETTTRL